MGPVYQKWVDCFTPGAAWTMSQNSVVQLKTPRCSYAQSSDAPLMVWEWSQVKSSNTECDGYPVSSVPIAASCFHVHRSSAGSSASGMVTTA